MEPHNLPLRCGFYARMKNGEIKSIFEVTKVRGDSYDTHIIKHEKVNWNNVEIKDVPKFLWNNNQLKKLTKEQMMEYL